MIMLSRIPNWKTCRRRYNAGADEYLVIPYDPLVLEAKVER